MVPNLILQVHVKVCVTSVWPTRLLSSIWGVLMIGIQFIGPVIILVYCQGRIAWTLTRRIDSDFGTENSASEVENKISKKFQKARNNMIKTVLLVGICFIICWVNDEVYLLMYFLDYDVDWNGLYYKFCISMVYLNCTINPFVYLIKYQDYQRALKNFCFKHQFKLIDGHPETEKSSVISIANSQFSQLKIQN